MGEARAKKLEEIEALQKKAVELDLEEAPIIAQFTPEELLIVWNGIGPEWLPAVVRYKLTKYLAIFAPACFIHDFHFWAMGNTLEEFEWANDVLERNARRCIDSETKWYQLLRRMAGYYAAHLLAEACRNYGWSAFIAGKEEVVVNSRSRRKDDLNSALQLQLNTTTNREDIIPLSNSNSKLELTHSLTLALLTISLLSGCYRSITVSRTDEWNLTYRSVGLKTDVSKIKAEKTTNGTVRVLVEGVATDVSERNAAIVESSGTALGNIIEGAK